MVTADAFTPEESVDTLDIASITSRALNETGGFCELWIIQHLRVHLCQIHVHKTRKPAFRVDLASFYLALNLMDRIN